MASQKQSVDELLAILDGNVDRRKKYPFNYWDRIGFQKYCKRVKMTPLGSKSKKFIWWFVIYEHYRQFRRKKIGNLKFYIDPKTFLALLRYFYPTIDKKRMKFHVKVHGKIGHIKVEKARKAHTTKTWTKKKKEPTQLSDSEE